MYEIVPLTGLNGEKIVYDRQYILNSIHEVNNRFVSLMKKNAIKDTMLIEAYNSATIEGAVTTLQQVKKNFRNPLTKSDKMVVNTANALYKIYNSYRINDGTIRGLWEIETKDVCENTSVKGIKYRSGMVYIGSATQIMHTPAQTQDIQHLMTELFNYIDNSIKDKKNGLECSIISHFYFVYVHPFCDGNGRMTRILQNYILHNTGYTSIENISPSEEIVNNLNNYYIALRTSETPVGKNLDITPFFIYMLNILNNSCIKYGYNLSNKEFMVYEILKRRGMHAKIDSKEISIKLGISIDTSRNILNNLVKKRILLKTKKGNINKYTLQILL